MLAKTEDEGRQEATRPSTHLHNHDNQSLRERRRKTSATQSSKNISINDLKNKTKSGHYAVCWSRSVAPLRPHSHMPYCHGLFFKNTHIGDLLNVDGVISFYTSIYWLIDYLVYVCVVGYRNRRFKLESSYSSSWFVRRWGIGRFRRRESRNHFFREGLSHERISLSVLLGRRFSVRDYICRSGGNFTRLPSSVRPAAVISLIQRLRFHSLSLLVCV